jgi:quinol monooxygenase YgiN
MAADTVCTLVPYFQVKPGQLAAFKAGVPAYVERTKSEKGCAHYAFSALLAHLDNVGALLKETLKIADIARLEVHGPAAEIDKLRAPLAGLKPQFFVLEPGGIRR